MRVVELLDEYDLTIDDVRWYLSVVLAERLLMYEDKPEELAHFVWSGRLADELYDMEERYLASLQDQLDRELTDEPHVREILAEMEAAKTKRRRRSGPGGS
jgi:hypothetical protein